MRLNKLYTILKVIPMIALMVFVSACTKDDDGEKPVINQRDFSLADYFAAANNTQSSQYNTLNDALEKAGLVSALEGGSLTLLAPSDAAFTAAGIDLDDISADDLATILNYHLIDGELEAIEDGRITTLNGATIHVSGGVINGFATPSVDFKATNGIVYTLDGVLTPPVGNLSAVLAANSDLSLAAAAFAKSSISLTGNSNLTVFVPNNDAMEFAGLDQAGIDALSVGEIDSVLNYHIVAGDLFSTALADQTYATQLGALTVSPGVAVATGDPLDFNGAEVVSADLLASNGVAHVIDEVQSIPTTVLQAMGPDVDVNFGFDGLILDGLYGGAVRLGLEDTYFGDPSQEVTVIGACCGAFNEAAYPVDADLQAAIEAHIFDGLIDPLTVGVEGGTRITSIGGDEYVVTVSDNGSFINGSYSNAFGGGGFTATVYNGVLSNVVGVLVGLPEETLTETLEADDDYDLFNYALGLVVDGVDDADHTIFAMHDTTFMNVYGDSLVNVDSIMTLVEDGEEFFANLSNHAVPNWYFGVDLDDGTAPTLTAVSGNEIPFVYDAEGVLVILLDPKNLSNTISVTDANAYTTANGVVHAVSGEIVFPE